MQFNGYNTAIVSRGFSLIEVVIGMVVMSIAFAVISSLILPTEQQSADQLHQIKAAELAQSYLNEIQGKAFDENSDKAGGIIRCGENLTVCTNEIDFGPDTDEIDDITGDILRHLFDDVDDYHLYSEKITSTSSSLHDGYRGFSLAINVTYNGTQIGLAADAAKEVSINVTTPLGTVITFTTYRVNY